MTMPITIAAAAYPLSQFATLGDYKDKLARWIKEASDRKADLAVFPEYGAMEYACAAGITAASDLQASLEAVSAARPEMDAAHAELARSYTMHILASSGPSRGHDGRYTNAARLFAPSGQSGVQDKMMMTPFERDWGMTPGSALRVFETSIGVIAIAICYDSEFPLLVRAQVEAGATLVLIPSCTEFVSGFHRVRTAALARALEGGCFTVQSPTVGDAVWSPAVDHNSGAAGIFAPSERGLSDTGVIVEGQLNVPGWVTATIDPSKLTRIRDAGEMRNFLDWPLQPGAHTVQQVVERVSLL